MLNCQNAIALATSGQRCPQRPTSKFGVFMKLATLIFAAVILCGCTQPDHATRTLENAGYTHIEITGWRPFSCGDGDTFATGFKAIGPTGHQVTGVVCEGLIFKASTIRLD
jgi:hypothetical protein